MVKKGYLYLITTGRDFILSVLMWIRDKFRTVKQVAVDYFIKSEEELTKDELRLQIEWIGRLLKFLGVLVTFTLVRWIVRWKIRR